MGGAASFFFFSFRSRKGTCGNLPSLETTKTPNLRNERGNNFNKKPWNPGWLEDFLVSFLGARIAYFQGANLPFVSGSVVPLQDLTDVFCESMMIQWKLV